MLSTGLIIITWEAIKNMKWLAQVQSHKCLKTNTWKFTRSISSTRKDHSVLLTNVKVSKDKYISKWVYWQNLIYVGWNNMKYCEQGQGWWSMEEKCSFMIPNSSPLFHGLVWLASSKLLENLIFSWGYTFSTGNKILCFEWTTNFEVKRCKMKDIF